MTNFKGTKGPWFALEYAGTHLIQDEDFYESNDILMFQDVGEEIARANAKLIVCAPEMLQALILERGILLSNGVDWNNAEHYNSLDNLIKKATE